MNKAEEQYLYNKGRIDAQSVVMELAFDIRNNEFFKQSLKRFCTDYRDSINNKGRKDYYNTILRLIDNNVITDWPSFVTYMTGETYE